MQLLSQPTAPYREQLVIQWMKKELEGAELPFFQDSAGNLVLGVRSEQEYRILLSRSSSEPVRIFVAHMDHPGFHGVRWNKAGLEIKWYGGSPKKHLVGSDVWLCSEDGLAAKGKLIQASLSPQKTHLNKGVVKCSSDLRDSKPETIFGGWAFRAPAWEKGGLIYTKAADDLVGCFAVLETAKKAHLSGKGHFIGLLTRAEEVGFVGCIAHFELGFFQLAKRLPIVVSLETSRTLPGALIGKGPVVRLGDRASIFSAEAVEVLHQVAKKVLPKKFQRRVMDGGTCEATVAVANRIPAMGISIPLGNYHNQGFEGGPDCRGSEGPAPEFVSLSDIRGMLRLCEGLLEEGLPWQDPWSSKREDLKKYLEEGTKLLRPS